MKPSRVLKKLALLLQRPYFTSKEARDLGVSSKSLAYYVKTGRLQRISRGVYQSTDFKGHVSFRWEDLIESVYSVSGGVVCLVSALAIYELTEEIPRQHWIASKSKSPYKNHAFSKHVLRQDQNGS